jgi:hypothetical protein
VPAVDRRVELHAGIAALVGGLGDLPEQVARLVAAHGLAGEHRAGPPVAVFNRTARMNSSVTRTELLAFWKKIEL